MLSFCICGSVFNPLTLPWSIIWIFSCFLLRHCLLICFQLGPPSLQLFCCPQSHRLSLCPSILGLCSPLYNLWFHLGFWLHRALIFYQLHLTLLYQLCYGVFCCSGAGFVFSLSLALLSVHSVSDAHLTVVVVRS